MELSAERFEAFSKRHHHLFLYPDHFNFNFGEFYHHLAEQGILIYPGKLTNTDCFRIGSIGHLFPHDVATLLTAISRVMLLMRFSQ